MKVRVIERFPEYDISEEGKVTRNVDSQRYQKAGLVLKGRVLASGYRQYKLRTKSGDQALVRSCRLVCEAFHGPAPSDRHHAAHKDGNKLNDTAKNLYWATPKQNKRDSFRHGTAVRGERTRNQHGKPKLDPEKVKHIRDSYQGTRGELTSFARQYDVGVTCIRNVLNGITWRHVRQRRSALDQRQGAQQ